MVEKAKEALEFTNSQISRYGRETLAQFRTYADVRAPEPPGHAQHLYKFQSHRGNQQGAVFE